MNIENDLFNAFLTFWGGFVRCKYGSPQDLTPIPAYHDLAVYARINADRPDPPQFPYITFNIARADAMTNAMATASIWNRTPGVPGDFGLVNDVLSQVSEVIPYEGICIPVGDGGHCVFYRGSGDFTGRMTDPGDAWITRGVINYVVRSYFL